ncbi:hypothetical protein FBZ96_105711 [Bradyrhizobium stylosanthis]|uniref:Uncharacterized protein n=1 Tax=Bradyrhizobium stylosanthis TaxID=1803665 RepID=A0A560DPJ9_9BRAD|nr:hypothetical protein FBZ96_105711 [Bradyrhizobium stylosanthis]
MENVPSGRNKSFAICKRNIRFLRQRFEPEVAVQERARTGKLEVKSNVAKTT